METTFKYRVLYADTDAMGVVYYGNYLRIYEAARGDFLRKIHLPFSALITEKQIICPVVKAEIQYHKYASLDEEITVKTKISDITGARMLFSQEIYSEDGKLLNEIKVTVAFIDMKVKRPTRCPEEFNQFLSQQNADI